MLLDVGVMPSTLVPLHPIGHGNTTVVLGHYIGGLTAIKQQVFSRGSWEISSHILAELLALQELKGSTWSPHVLFHSVSQDMVQIGMEYIPISMKQMVRFGIRNMNVYSRIFQQLLGAVHALHQHGMTHRDIKPDNIRFRSNGDLVLIDYDSCTMPNDHTTKTRRICTSGYRDPFLTVCTDEELTVYDYRALDAFSVGAVFLFLLNGGKHLFTGASDADIAQNTQSYVTTGLVAGCVRWKLPATDRRILCGLLALTPGKRITVTAATAAYRNIE
jgi:serine/threonine protein kinase